jgi:hypothetical protein
MRREVSLGLRKLCGISSTHIDGREQPFGQQLICNCRSARGKDGAFEDDGEAGTWFEPLDRRMLRQVFENIAKGSA